LASEEKNQPVRGDTKIRPTHLARAALIYVRQSTVAQVRNNTESTTRQYGLAQQAARLGWPDPAIQVIDADLGISGRHATNREGFKDLMGRVCLGEVGAIFGLEVLPPGPLLSRPVQTFGAGPPHRHLGHRRRRRL
jgi:hypothetical protein